jgi:peptide chain release factor 3
MGEADINSPSGSEGAPAEGGGRLAGEVARRRTFAIISHPDAGKTTLTEKLLLYGGAIHLAGAVKAKRASRHATSDWMELEKQRGISVTTSVMSFAYAGHLINLLDTPGHQDFSEDTYRTLAAADSAVMLIDAAKGVEAQTKKLFHVCRMRGIPIFTFVNKLDRHGREPLELMDDIEQVLGIRSCPMNWPVGMGPGFRGVYDRRTKKLHLFDTSGRHGEVQVESREADVNDPALREAIGPDAHRRLVEENEMLDLAGDAFDNERVQAGQLAPMYFGSAMTNFGVEPFLRSFIDLAPAPAPRKTAAGPVDPKRERFSGFIFKIQANMDPAHRDRIAFMRVVSGRFERGMTVKHLRLGKDVRLAKSTAFLAQERTSVEEAFAGDVIGLFDPGIFHIGDTLCEGGCEPFEGIPRFSPEHFVQVRVKDALKRKQLKAGLDQLSEEGAVQVFRQRGMGDQNPVLGAVGALQFDVLEFRLREEYGVEVILDKLPFTIARWLIGSPVNPRDYERGESSICVEDKNGSPIVLFRNEWALRWAVEHSPKGIELRATAD